MTSHSASSGPRSDTVHIQKHSHGSDSQVSECISLISRSFALLDIAQLRSLLSLFALPTTGTKSQLIRRLIIFVETFGPRQRYIIPQIQMQLHLFLSGAPPADAPPDPPPDAPCFIFRRSERADLCFGPIAIGPGDAPLEFAAPDAGGAHRILCVRALSDAPPLRRVALEISGARVEMDARRMWLRLPDGAQSAQRIRVLEADPPAAVAVCVRWMALRPVGELLRALRARGAPPPQSVELRPHREAAICPFSRKVMCHPARGVRCAHRDCFDLSHFIGTALMTNRWQCPFCEGEISPEDLRIDPSVLI